MTFVSVFQVRFSHCIHTITHHHHKRKIVKKILSFCIMKYLVAALILSQAAAFTVVGKARAPTQLMAEYTPMEGEGKINLKVRRRYWLRTFQYLVSSYWPIMYHAKRCALNALV
jgi:hypothetical protein